MTTGFLGAVQFLTRIPIRLRQPPRPASSIPWFPVVGGLIGLVVGAVAAGLHELLPATVAAAVAIAAGIALTGAFHEDGLADTADAMGGWSPSGRREILRDSRHGSYGVAALCTSIVIRILCVASLGPAAAVAGLVAAHSLGRASAVAVMGAVADRTEEGLGAEYARAVARRGPAASWLPWVGAAAGIALAAIATGWWVAPLVAAAGTGAVVVTTIGLRAFERIGGDLLGAIEQVGECLVLVVVSGLAMRHSVWWS